MEAFVATVKVLSQDKNWNDLKKLVKDSSVLILKNVSKIDSAISALDVNNHCLGHINLMVFKLSLPNIGDFELFFNQIQNIVEHGDEEQIFQCIDKYCHIFHLFTKCMIEQQQAFRGIRILMQAIEKGQKHPSELLSIHSDLLQLCLKARCMKPALRYLDVDITSINNEFGEYNCKMFLTYYYYGGMVYLALKKYEKALFFLQVAITTPALGVSRIMLEAYKKYILVSVLLHGKLVATDIIYNYFDHNINPKSKMRWRIVLNFFIKLIYVFINVLAFYLMNVFLNSHFKTYGRDWTNWANENTSYAMNIDVRVHPTPGNQMLPTFGLCDIHESQADSTTSYGNRHKILCEISSNILYQYVFLVLWFVLVFSIAVSIIGIFLNIYAHIVSAAIFVKNDKSAKYVYRFLTFRECEYLEYIRRKNLRLYGDVIRLLREMKLQHLTLAFTSMQDGLKKIGAQCDKVQAKAGQGIESTTYNSNGYTYDELAAEYGESFDDTFDTEFATNEPKPTFTRSVSDKMNTLKNKLGENNPKINRIPLVRRYVGANANTNKVKKHGGGGGGKRR